MFSYEEIRKVHLELTDKCNAACPQCSRNERGGPVNPLLPLTELTLDDIKTIFPPLSFEAFPSELENDYVPLHTYLLAEQGAPILELVNLEALSADAV